MTPMSLSEDLGYCAEQVRQGDPDRFATAMLAPMPTRGWLLSLYAFNLELARLREAVREPMLGEIRLQWWRDAIGECFDGTPRRHQVVHPLASLISEVGLPKEPFLAMIDFRARDLDTLPPADEGELTAYVESTGGALGELTLRISGQGSDEATTTEVGRALGRAWAWVGLARGLHPHRVQGRRVVPANRLSKAPELDDDLLKAKAGDAVREWTAWLLDRAEADLEMVRARQGGLTKQARIGLAPARLGARYAAKLRNAGNDPFRAELNQLTTLQRSWALIGFSFRGNRI